MFFRYYIKGERVIKNDEEFQENKTIFSYLERRVKEIEKAGHKFSNGDSLLDETKTFEVRIAR